MTCPSALTDVTLFAVSSLVVLLSSCIFLAGVLLLKRWVTNILKIALKIDTFLYKSAVDCHWELIVVSCAGEWSRPSTASLSLTSCSSYVTMTSLRTALTEAGRRWRWAGVSWSKRVTGQAVATQTSTTRWEHQLTSFNLEDVVARN